ncbi:MAG: hypothetical protein AB2L13_12460 [Spirochaetota bacterium]
MKKIAISITFFCLIANIVSDRLLAELPDCIIVTHNADVKSGPNIESDSLIQLPVAHKALLIKNKEKIKAHINNIHGAWVYIDTKGYKNIGDKETVKGWIFDHDMASDNFLKNRKNLKRISSFKRYKIDFKGWNQHRIWDIRPDGSFMYRYYGYETISERGVEKGRLYQHKDLIIAFLEPKGTITDYFYFKDDGMTLCCTWPDYNGEIICVEPLK